MISAPVDYGLSPEQTLRHEIDSNLPTDFNGEFESHWSAFREAVATLATRWQGTIDSPFNQVVIRSLDSVRIAVRVAMPAGAAAVRGIVVTSHGYANVSDEFGEEAEPWCERGLAVVRVRVRGYPPSTLDMPDLRGDWIMHKPPHTPAVSNAWIVRGAVADIMRAVRCARAHFGAEVPVTLHGESLGGGLAAMAAAQLTLMHQPPARLILALPSLGDWRWRALRYCNGSGGQLNMLLDALRGGERDSLLRGLLLYDAALHATAVQSPALVKLAQHDDVVPAPSAAAIFNGLQSQPKARFVTRYGHFDGGIADGRRHVLFERLAMDFADPVQTPGEILESFAATLELPATTRNSG